MKISITYPPLVSKKGTAAITQNRQFQWFSSPTYIYPVIPAYAATLLAKNGYYVFWDDAITQELAYSQWKERIIREKPDIIAIETKTPIIKSHWKIIDELKKELPDSKIILMGDHVTALPQESLKNSGVDYVIASGDYDFALLNLANHMNKGDELEGGFWWRKREKLEVDPPAVGSTSIANSGPADLSRHDLNNLPLIDRELTRWKDYAFKNGNFKYKPGAYLMSARDCWWGRCTFCSWTTMFPGDKFRTMSAEKALDEIGNLISLGAKEIMEDSGSLPVGQWLHDFCDGLIKRGYDRKIKISCNMRINGIKDVKIWQKMKKAGFRMILFGLESANQGTLDQINKNLKVEEIEPGLAMCKEAGLEPHITAMIGYPWENETMARKTIDLAKKLFKSGYVDTLQGTVMIPYPGTPLYKYCQENDLLLTDDYDRFDQREMVMKSPIETKKALELVQELYKSFLSPQFILRKVISIRTFDDFKFLFMAGWKWLGKMVDFKS